MKPSNCCTPKTIATEETNTLHHYQVLTSALPACLVSSLLKKSLRFGIHQHTNLGTPSPPPLPPQKSYSWSHCVPPLSVKDVTRVIENFAAKTYDLKPSLVKMALPLHNPLTTSIINEWLSRVVLPLTSNRHWWPILKKASLGLKLCIKRC